METRIVKIMNVVRIVLTVLMAVMIGLSLWAVMFEGRLEHLLTAAGYALIIWIVNLKEEQD